MAPFTPTGGNQRRSLYSAGNDSYGTRKSNTYHDSRGSYGSGGSDSNSYLTGNGSYGSGDSGKNVYSDSRGKYGVGDTGKNSYMTGVSNIAPEKESPKSWTKVHKSSFPKGGIMRSSAGTNINGGTGNGYAERDTSSLYYTGDAGYQKGSRSAAPKSAPKRKSYADSIPRPAAVSLGSLSLDDMTPPGYAYGGTVNMPNPADRQRGDFGSNWRGMFGSQRRPEDTLPQSGGYAPQPRDHSLSAPYMSTLQRGPGVQPPQPPAGGYPPPPAHSMPQMPQPAPAPSAGPSGSIPPPAFQNGFWRR